MNLNHTTDGPVRTSYKIQGTVSPESLSRGKTSEHDLNLWANYLGKQLKARLEDVTDVEIRLAPFGGTRLTLVGENLKPDAEFLTEIAKSIFDDFCFNYDSIAHHGMSEGFPKPGEEEC